MTWQEWADGVNKDLADIKTRLTNAERRIMTIETGISPAVQEIRQSLSTLVLATAHNTEMLVKLLEQELDEAQLLEIRKRISTSASALKEAVIKNLPEGEPK